MLNWRLFRNTDYLLWFAVIGLLLVSALSIFSTTPLGSPLRIRHIISIIFGVGVMGLAAYMDYRHWQKAAWLLYATALLLLLIVIFAGSSAQGAQRWLNLGPLSFQPSEICKIFVVITLANYFKNRRELIENIRQLIPFFVLLGVPFLLIAKQPDLGTALVILAIGLGTLVWAQCSPLVFVYLLTPLASIVFRQHLLVWMVYLIILFAALYLARVNWMAFAFILLLNVGVGIAWTYIWHLLQVYQQQRILTFLNPAADPLGSGYHSLQSKIAVGSGLLFGKGFLHGTQTQLRFIPIQHADFVFSQIAEEFGLIGSAIVTGLLLTVVWRAFSIASQAADSFGGFLASGIGFLMLFQIVINLGMTMGSLPVVGIPLPFLSFGGTSILVSCLAAGILQSIYLRREKLFF